MRHKSYFPILFAEKLLLIYKIILQELLLYILFEKCCCKYIKLICKSTLQVLFPILYARNAVVKVMN